MKTIRWGIIGCGNVTETKSGPAFQKAENSALVAVMRRNGILAEDYAKRHGVPKWYDNAHDLIQDEEVDAVYIATPPAFHKEYTLSAARAGKPVYVEKPMALNFSECEDMIRACEGSSVPLFVAYYRRALPRFIKIKELLDQKAIGDVRFVSTTQYRPVSQNDVDRENRPWRLQPQLSGGGYFFDLASHTLDLLDFLLGPIVKVNGFASNQSRLYEAEDTVTGSYVFQCGAHGVGTWCFSAFAYTDINEIVGSEGKIVFSTFGHEPVQVVNQQGSSSYSFAAPDHIQQDLIQTVVDELLGKESCPSHGDSAARTNRVMDVLVGEYYKES